MTRKFAADIELDERLIFFPTIGRHVPARDTWELPIHGWVFEPEADSLRRAAALRIVRRWIGLNPTDGEAATFNQRMHAFLVDNQPDKVVTIRIDGQPGIAYQLPRSAPDGHFDGLVRLGRQAAESLIVRTDTNDDPATAHDMTIPFAAVLPTDDMRSFTGRIHLIEPQGVSVISDIDDTIKVSHVNNRGALMRQTFLRTFEPVEGMAELYRRWRAAGAAFHYVSRSPWQLYQPLAQFFADNRFPAGTVHLRKFRWRNAGTLLPDGEGRKKRATLEALLTWLPERSFVLVGDASQRDPEIYGDLARRFPQVRYVFIRNVRGESRGDMRYTEAMHDLPANQWRLFDRPEELPDSLV